MQSLMLALFTRDDGELKILYGIDAEAIPVHCVARFDSTGAPRRE
jgi:hypothetical protein